MTFTHRFNFNNMRAAFAVSLLSLMVNHAANAQLNLGVPEELKGVDIIEHLNEPLPLTTMFTDDGGNSVRLADYFKGERPVLLQLGYNKCPMLCNLVLNGAFDGLQGVDWLPGNEFEVVSISVDPTESFGLAKAKKESYLAVFERPGSAKGVHFLTGSAVMSKAVADAVGFEFRLQENGDYSHAAALFLITPEGRISRYMYGTKFESADLRMGLLEASQGRIGTTLDRFILWCHIYDPNARGYVLQAQRVMTIGGAVTVLVLAGGLAVLWRAELHRKKKSVSAGAVVAH
ncbi:MAG: SCO family protein [Planctomycetota bacterium]|nr:MAG: SCO family protein [Planctomycetota bacterium]RLS96074.1 MAG: SCO family protein [Planctomycetota bacterium]